jgi:hypothetical protein
VENELRLRVRFWVRGDSVAKSGGRELGKLGSVKFFV